MEVGRRKGGRGREEERVWEGKEGGSVREREKPSSERRQLEPKFLLAKAFLPSETFLL